MTRQFKFYALAQGYSQARHEKSSTEFLIKHNQGRPIAVHYATTHLKDEYGHNIKAPNWITATKFKTAKNHHDHEGMTVDLNAIMDSMGL